MDFSQEEEQHKVIHEGLEKLLGLIHAAQADHAQFKAAEIRELMVNFKEPLVRPHGQGVLCWHSNCFLSTPIWTKRSNISPLKTCAPQDSRNPKSSP